MLKVRVSLLLPLLALSHTGCFIIDEEAKPSDATDVGEDGDDDEILPLSVSLEPDSPGTDDALQAVASGGDGSTIDYAWTVNGEAVSVSSDTLDGTVFFDRADTVAVTVSDASDTPAASASVEVVNTPPAMITVTLSPDTVTAGSPVTCSHDDATDADGDTVTYTYAWTESDTDLGVTDAALGGDLLARGDTLRCGVTPSDGMDDGETVWSAPVVVANSPPAIVGVSIEPDAPTVEDTLVCSYTGFSDPDDDADASTFGWSINGAYAGSGSSLGSGYVRGDEVTCIVTPHDGEDGGTPLSATVNVETSPPRVAAVTVGPDPARAGDTLTHLVGFEDADGHADSSTVEWFLNGETAGTGETFAGDFVHGDTVRCVVTPFDGIDAGEAVSTDLVVSNTPPVVIGAVTISPNPPYDGVSLSCWRGPR